MKINLKKKKGLFLHRSPAVWGVGGREVQCEEGGRARAQGPGGPSGKLPASGQGARGAFGDHLLQPQRRPSSSPCGLSWHRAEQELCPLGLPGQSCLELPELPPRLFPALLTTQPPPCLLPEFSGTVGVGMRDPSLACSSAPERPPKGLCGRPALTSAAERPETAGGAPHARYPGGLLC